MTTRGQIYTSTRVAADQDTSTYPTQTAVNDIIDRAARTVWRRMIAEGWKPLRTTVTITANGVTSYPIGTDVSVVHTVHFLGNPGTQFYRVPLKRAKPEQLPDLLAFPAGMPACAYDLIGGGTSTMTIELYPVPNSGTYEVRYTPKFAGFASDSDTWFGPDGSEELIILTSAIECVNKEGDPAGMVASLEKRLNRRWDEIIETAGWTDSMGQQTVRDARNRTRYPFDYNVVDAMDQFSGGFGGLF